MTKIVTSASDGLFMTISFDLIAIWSEVSMAQLCKMKSLNPSVKIQSGSLEVEDWVTILFSDGQIFSFNWEEFIDKTFEATVVFSWTYPQVSTISNFS